MPMTFNQRVLRFDEYDAFLDDLTARGASDGLPVVPPTKARVRAALDAAGLEPGDVLGEIPTREVVLDAERVAINAVMAGCRPEYLPVVAAAVRAWSHPLANGHGTSATLAGSSHPVIVNGPIARRLGFTGGPGCLGPGNRANATVGRALRLAMRNMAWAIPGFSDRAAFSQPARYSFCFAEDEAATSWNPLHVERGWAAEDDVVTVASNTDCFTFAEDTGEPEPLLDGLVSLARARPIHVDRFVGEWRSVLFVVGPAHRRVLESCGWSKADVRSYLHPRLTAPHTFEPARPAVWGSEPTGSVGEYAFFLPRAENIHLIAAGGPTSPTLVLYPHQSSAISAAVTTNGAAGRMVPAADVVDGRHPDESEGSPAAGLP
ncbi:MAG TPA: hypothetical protein VHS57_00775 [Acidimicrobiales bacterium]|jgi:hypothetical protein|nr:hypothetical protein [Acidimicrobiales bacterium]